MVMKAITSNTYVTSDFTCPTLSVNANSRREPSIAYGCAAIAINIVTCNSDIVASSFISAASSVFKVNADLTRLDSVAINSNVIARV